MQIERSDLELVLAVRDHGSLATAAVSLHLAAPAVTPAPHAITRTSLGACFGNSVAIWPSMRCNRMSCGSLDACTLPAL